MSAFEITLICILGTFLFLMFFVAFAAVRLLSRVTHLIRTVESKFNHVDSRLGGHHHVCSYHDEEPCYEERGGISQLIDALADLGSVAMTGMELWKKHRKRRR